MKSVHKDLLVLKDQMAHKVIKETKVTKEIKVIKEDKDQLDQMAHNENALIGFHAKKRMPRYQSQKAVVKTVVKSLLTVV